MAGWIENQGNRSGAVWQVEGESGHDCSAQILRLLAACLDIGHLNIDHSVEPADLAFSNSQRPDRRATRDDFYRQISSPHRGKLPIEELAVEILGLREIGRGDVEPGDVARSDIRRERLGGSP